MEDINMLKHYDPRYDRFATSDEMERDIALRHAQKIICGLTSTKDFADNSLLDRIYDRISEQRIHACKHCGLIGGH